MGNGARFSKFLRDYNYRIKQLKAVHIMLLPSQNPSSSYSLLKFVDVTSQLRHFLEVHPLLRNILDPPLT